MHHALTDIRGISVGHWSDLEAGTGCTVILCPDGAVAGVDIRGGSPGTRETALLDPVCTVEQVHGVLLTGGSAFGLAAADGVMRWLEEQGAGYDVGVAKVPIVPAAVLFDLPLGRADVRPDAAAGYAACVAASAGPLAEGNVGAGAGATVGKFLGFKQATQGGLGTASRLLANGVIVAALVVVNAAGDVHDPHTGQILAGARTAAESRHFADLMRQPEQALARPIRDLEAISNTTLVVVATNAKLSKTEVTKVAQMAHDGLARTIWPVHTAIDGDIVFALSLGSIQGDATLVGAVAAEVVAEAVVRGVSLAESLHGIPSARNMTYAAPGDSRKKNREQQGELHARLA
jgi:L-aminopeptidase/D-esterase-like protein